MQLCLNFCPFRAENRISWGLEDTYVGLQNFWLKQVWAGYVKRALCLISLSAAAKSICRVSCFLSLLSLSPLRLISSQSLGLTLSVSVFLKVKRDTKNQPRNPGAYNLVYS